MFNGVFGRFLPQIRENIVQYKLYIHAFLRYTYLFGRNVGYSWEYIGINVAPPLRCRGPEMHVLSVKRNNNVKKSKSSPLLMNSVGIYTNGRDASSG
jgi:hypothetical protein